MERICTREGAEVVEKAMRAHALAQLTRNQTLILDDRHRWIVIPGLHLPEFKSTSIFMETLKKTLLLSQEEQEDSKSLFSQMYNRSDEIIAVMESTCFSGHETDEPIKPVAPFPLEDPVTVEPMPLNSKKVIDLSLIQSPEQFLSILKDFEEEKRKHIEMTNKYQQFLLHEKQLKIYNSQMRKWKLWQRNQLWADFESKIKSHPNEFQTWQQLEIDKIFSNLNNKAQMAWLLHEDYKEIKKKHDRINQLYERNIRRNKLIQERRSLEEECSKWEIAIRSVSGNIDQFYLNLLGWEEIGDWDISSTTYERISEQAFLICYTIRTPTKMENHIVATCFRVE